MISPKFPAKKYSIAKNLVMHPLNSIRNKALHKRSDFFIDALHILVLFAFALAQPLFDLLSKHAEFFVARKSEPVDIVLLIIILCLVLPAIAVLIEGVAGLIGRRFRKAIHWFMVATLLAVIALQVLKKVFESPGIALIVIAAVLGVAATVAYVHFRRARVYLTALSPAILIFPALFLFNSPVFKVVFPEKDPSAIEIKIEDPPPIIMVVFDEFPVTALMDEDGKIDPIRYPNFAALAKDSYWFRNAMTVAAETTLIIPAMLAGNLPDRGQQPTAADHPHNLFTSLGSTYDLKVLETLTQLCPEELCADALFRGSVIERIDSLLRDLSVVYPHMVLPADLTSALPAISQGWMDFVHPTAGPKGLVKEKSHNKKMVHKRSLREKRGDRAWQFSQFIDSIVPANHPTLYFIHIMLPHRPWEYLPSGKKYAVLSNNKIWDFLPHGKKLNAAKIMGTGIGAKRHEIWGNDEWVVTQAYQLFLLQVGFVDRLLGQLMEKLKAINLYDRSLLVVTADHGMSFRANDYTRIVTESNAGDITSVPLFIKRPNQHAGVLYDRKVETIDLLPTIADILNIELPYAIDGRSALDESLSESGEILFLNPANFPKKLRFTKEELLNVRRQTLRWKLDIFGSGKEPEGLYKIGQFNYLIGRAVQNIPVVESNFSFELDQESFYTKVDKGATFTPSRFTGRVFTSSDSKGSFNLAISINGIVSAVTQTFPLEGGAAEWSAMVPEKAFQMGKNSVEVFVVSQDGRDVVLKREGTHKKVVYALSNLKGSAEESIISLSGDTIPVVQNALTGYLDTAIVGKDQLFFSGWAADIRNSQLPETILIFVNGNFFYSGQCNVFRPELAKAWHNDTLRWAGFKYVFPLTLFQEIGNTEVRFFAVSTKGMASELIYPKGYKLTKKKVVVPPVIYKDGQRELIRTKKKSRVTYSVTASTERGEMLSSSDGKAIQVVPDALRAYLGHAEVIGDNVIIEGWAADLERSQLPEAIIIFVNGEFFFSGDCNAKRSDVVKAFGNPRLEESGFEYRFPLSSFADIDNAEVRIYAVSKRDLATEVYYPEGYKRGIRLKKNI